MERGVSPDSSLSARRCLANQRKATKIMEKEFLQNPYFFKFSDSHLIDFFRKLNQVMLDDPYYDLEGELRPNFDCQNPHLLMRQEAADLPRSEDIISELTEFFSKLKRYSQQNIPSLSLAAWAHAEIIRIFPFCSGNGRLARMFMNAINIRYGQMPLIFDNEESYYDACIKNLKNPGYFVKYLTEKVIPWNRAKKFTFEELE